MIHLPKMHFLQLLVSRAYFSSKGDFFLTKGNSKEHYQMCWQNKKLLDRHGVSFWKLGDKCFYVEIKIYYRVKCKYITVSYTWQIILNFGSRPSCEYASILFFFAWFTLGETLEFQKH